MTSHATVGAEEARLPRLSPDEATGGVKTLFDAFMKQRGNVPNLFRVAAHRPAIVETLFAHLQAVTGPGTVSTRLKELLAMRVSHLNDCGYCLASHTTIARKLGASDADVQAVERGDYAGFEPGWAAALRWADAVTPTRGDASDALFADLSAHWSAEQIVEITAVITLFNHFNRFAEALRIPVTR